MRSPRSNPFGFVPFVSPYRYRRLTLLLTLLAVLWPAGGAGAVPPGIADTVHTSGDDDADEAYASGLPRNRGSAILVGAQGEEPYLLYDGMRHRADAATLAALGFDAPRVHHLDRGTLARIPTGDRFPPLANGSFISAPDGTRYLIHNGVHAIPDNRTFEAYGWGGARGFAGVPITPVDATFLAALPPAAPLVPQRAVGAGLFDWGYCTWWVAQRRAVPWLGNAAEWYGAARGMGYAVGATPLPGAILVRQSASWSGYGHVAYVESVEGKRFTVSEMNIRAVGELTVRTYDMTTDPPPGLIGFIYWRYAGE
ncbi:MAG: hypothetical protein AVDCRST_MAG88-1911 [uncultured Thermomicrobiales bacterium]|uniref:Peptidase C51 domain-containing protein n=1 Tax=uncultured Thermomicrobiales bacterium TaxID=1645740 RepID=A0A6J4V2L0_9BACT|nr:MAG: hypothetical protein AVDCRST_MAG88-1911 [uncultured Thermomicrobiales bacterium]